MGSSAPCPVRRVQVCLGQLCDTSRKLPEPTIRRPRAVKRLGFVQFRVNCVSLDLDNHICAMRISKTLPTASLGFNPCTMQNDCWSRNSMSHLLQPWDFSYVPPHNFTLKLKFIPSPREIASRLVTNTKILH